MSTHMAVYACIYPPDVQLMAVGDRDWCEARLAEHVERRPPGQWTRALVVEIVSETINEPGVGVYSVERERV